MSTANHQLTIERDYEQPVSAVYAAWRDPELLRRWFAPGEMKVAAADVDFRPGGAYRIVMQGESEHIVTGQYVDLKDDRRIICTWQWEGSELVTRLDVRFEPRANGGCRLILVHSEFTDQETCDLHQEGWNGCLANFNKALPELAV